MCEKYFTALKKTICRLLQENKNISKSINGFFESIIKFKSENHELLISHIKTEGEKLAQKTSFKDGREILSTIITILVADITNNQNESLEEKKVEYQNILDIINEKK